MERRYDIIVDGELYHHGIKGQRWGVRRYQNDDGTLTEAGKKRYAKMESYRSSELRKLDKKIAKKQKTADRNIFSAVELGKLELEKSGLLNMSTDDLIKERKKVVSNVTGAIGATIASQALMMIGAVPIGFILSPNTKAVKRNIRSKHANYIPMGSY